MRHRTYYRRLTIAQTKLALAAGYAITAADGEAWLPSDVMRKPLELPTATLHRTAFDHLRKRGLIKLNESKSRIPKTQFHDRSGNWYAVWEAAPEKGNAP